MSLAPAPETWEVHADRAADLEAKGDEQQWEAADEYAEAAKTATGWEIAERVGKKERHINYMIAASLSIQPGHRGSFAEAYRSVKKPRNPWTKRASEQWASLDTSLVEALIVADIRKAEVGAETVDVIITDPPYPEEFLDTYAYLAEFGARVLKPGGHLLAMAGQSYLPEVFERMLEHGLTYAWTLAYLTPGGQAVQLWDRKFNTFWKPIVFFTKGDSDRPWRGDVVSSDVNANEKDVHPWQQSESGIVRLITDFSEQGDLVADPFLGGGTTAGCALSLGRRFLGIDVDPNAVAATKARLGL